MKKYISENIHLSPDRILKEITTRQGLPWNNGRIAEYKNFPVLQRLYKIINSGIPYEDFFFNGNIFRLHTQDFDMSLPKTDYSRNLVSFSKSCDFTRPVYYKVNKSEQSRLIHVNTGNHYGIDVNKLMERLTGEESRFSEEQEVLFPLLSSFVVKEYTGSPNQFKYYLRKYL